MELNFFSNFHFAFNKIYEIIFWLFPICAWKIIHHNTIKTQWKFNMEEKATHYIWMIWGKLKKKGEVKIVKTEELAGKTHLKRPISFFACSFATKQQWCDIVITNNNGHNLRLDGKCTHVQYIGHINALSMLYFYLLFTWEMKVRWRRIKSFIAIQQL